MAHGGKGGDTRSPQKKRLCPWITCKAARAGQYTLGDRSECFCCNVPFARCPPIEKMAEWAYKAKMQEGEKQKASAAEAAPKEQVADKKKGQGKGTQQPYVALGVDELKQLREKRLAELNALKAPAAAAPAQAAAARAPAKEQPSPGQLDPDSLLEVKEIQSTVAEILESIKADVSVDQPAPRDAEAALAAHLVAFQPVATAEAKPHSTNA